MKDSKSGFNAKENYSDWQNNAKVQIIKLKTKGRIFSWLRLLLFILWSVFVVMIFSAGTLFILPMLLTLAAFIIFIARDQKNQINLRYWEQFSKVLDDELKALVYDFTFNSGSQYVDPSHPFINDLDVFGDKSLFQSINRTATIKGSDYLANSLKDLNTDHDVIKNHQQAIIELSSMPEWLLKFRTYGLLGKSLADSEDELKEWVYSRAIFNSAVYGPLLIILPAISLMMLGLLITGTISFGLFMLYLAIPLGLPAIHASKISKKHSQLSRKSELLETYGHRLLMIENETFHSVTLNRIKKNVINNNASAGKSIKSLGRIISSMDVRLNWLMWIILNYLLLWDIRQTIRLEKWQKRHKKNIEGWLDSLANIEALGSIAGFSIINPEFIFPEISNDQLYLSATHAGHPLIPKLRRVDNDILISGNSSFSVITGANMAGKSTYLRTVAVNLILASIGAPVCAKSFIFFPAIPYTSLHTLDSLSSNKSYFFAELERLKMIIETLNAGKSIYIFLDEILKGTNSHDKQHGSIALLKQLIKLKAAGMIATHDLELGKLEIEFPENIINKCFEAEISATELVFDYKLRPGIAKNMNATFLMKRMGITIDDV